MLVVVDMVSNLPVTLLAAQKFQQGSRASMVSGEALPKHSSRMVARSRSGFGASNQRAQLHMLLLALRAERPMTKTAPDLSAEWLGEVVDMEGGDAQHHSGASDLEPDEVDNHGHD